MPCGKMEKIAMIQTFHFGTVICIKRWKLEKHNNFQNMWYTVKYKGSFFPWVFVSDIFPNLAALGLCWNKKMSLLILTLTQIWLWNKYYIEISGICPLITCRKYNVNTREINLRVKFKILLKIQDPVKLTKVLLGNCFNHTLCPWGLDRVRLVKMEEEKVNKKIKNRGHLKDNNLYIKD